MDLANLIPAGGLGAVSVGGTLLAVVVYLLNANRQDRKEYQDAIDRAEARADAADVRRQAAEAKLDGVQQALDAERAARRAAEDRAALAERNRPPVPGGGP